MKKLISRLTSIFFLVILFFTILIFNKPQYIKSFNEEKPDLSTERILSFSSDIEVKNDSSYLVTENITVNVLNREINHGIFRDFPTIYKKNIFLNRKVDFNVKSVQLDDKTESYTVEGIDNGVRVKIGNPNVIVPVGIHKYSLQYVTKRQSNYTNDKDELFYNITGNYWDFPIDKASAKITLPSNFNEQDLKITGYTGLTGSKEEGVHYNIDNSGSNTIIYLNSNRFLRVHEGLTAKIDWPKGYINHSPNDEGLIRILKDNPSIVITPIFILFLLLYYLYMWVRHGIDPKHQTIIPLYNPPENLSPGEMRYICLRNYDNKAAVASIVNLAVNGFIKITENETKGILGFGAQKYYTLEKVSTDKVPEFSEEIDLLDHLFLSNTQTITLEKKYDPQIADTIDKYKSILDTKYGKGYFEGNYCYLAFGFFVTVLYFGFASTLKFGLILAIGLFFQVLLHIIFYFLLRRRTEMGSKVKDEIDGFKMFLNVAEEDDIKALYNKFPNSLDLYEKYLPYAIALDVELNWTKKFENLIAQSITLDEQNGYSNGWYSGTGSFNNSFFLVNSLSQNFSESLSTASTIPSSSGGSGGSGGGGGGGGGGGW